MCGINKQGTHTHLERDTHTESTKSEDTICTHNIEPCMHHTHTLGTHSSHKALRMLVLANTHTRTRVGGSGHVVRRSFGVRLLACCLSTGRKLVKCQRLSEDMQHSRTKHIHTHAGIARVGG